MLAAFLAIGNHLDEEGPMPGSGTVRAAALDLGYVDGETFDRVVDPRTMLGRGLGPDR